MYLRNRKHMEWYIELNMRGSLGETRNSVGVSQFRVSQTSTSVSIEYDL
jgi:hypothetical protein